MADKLGTSVDVSSGGQDTHYVPGHDRYDAVKFVADSGNTTADDVTITFATYESNEVRDAKDNGDFSAMDQVAQNANVDPSGGGSWGTTSLARAVAVRVNDNTGTGADGVTGTIHLHDASDPNENAHAFVDR